MWRVTVRLTGCRGDKDRRERWGKGREGECQAKATGKKSGVRKTRREERKDRKENIRVKTSILTEAKEKKKKKEKGLQIRKKQEGK